MNKRCHDCWAKRVWINADSKYNLDWSSSFVFECLVERVLKLILSLLLSTLAIVEFHGGLFWLLCLHTPSLISPRVSDRFLFFQQNLSILLTISWLMTLLLCDDFILLTSFALLQVSCIFLQALGHKLSFFLISEQYHNILVLLFSIRQLFWFHTKLQVRHYYLRPLPSMPHCLYLLRLFIYLLSIGRLF